MAKRHHILFLWPLLLLQACIIHTPAPKQSSKGSVFRQMNFQDLIQRYMKKGGGNSIEGVYSVSGMVIKRGKTILGGPKEKTTDRKENYATVAILREEQIGGNYIELSLNKKDLTSYSIIGEFKPAAAGGILVYKHYDSKGKDTSYTFTRDETSEILEGIRVDDEGGTQVTYKLTYVKLSPQ